MNPLMACRVADVASFYALSRTTQIRTTEWSLCGTKLISNINQFRHFRTPLIRRMKRKKSQEPSKKPRFSVSKNKAHTSACVLVTVMRVVNPSQSRSKYEECCSQLSTYFKGHVIFRKADESLACSDKTWRFLQTCIITFQNKYSFWVFYSSIVFK
jgi:hypothetical protein